MPRSRCSRTHLLSKCCASLLHQLLVGQLELRDLLLDGRVQRLGHLRVHRGEVLRRELRDVARLGDEGVRGAGRVLEAGHVDVVLLGRAGHHRELGQVGRGAFYILY